MDRSSGKCTIHFSHCRAMGRRPGPPPAARPGSAGRERRRRPFLDLAQYVGADPRHDPHRRDNVGAVRDLDAELRVVRVEVSHDERNHIHGAPAHGSGEEVRAASPSSPPESTQLLVKPASCSFSEQMKVRSSTLATSLGSEKAANELGNCSALSRTRVPARTRWSVSSCIPGRIRPPNGCGPAASARLPRPPSRARADSWWGYGRQPSGARYGP